MQVAPLAAAFVGYVVFWNLSLQMNSVGFYQLSKIMVLPSVAALEVCPALAHACLSFCSPSAMLDASCGQATSISCIVMCMQCLITGRKLTKLECSAIALVVLGVVLATVTDSSVTTNMLGVVLSIAAILFSAVYQVGSPTHVPSCAQTTSIAKDVVVTLLTCQFPSAKGVSGS